MLAPQSTRASVAHIGGFVAISIVIHALVLPSTPWFLKGGDEDAPLTVDDRPMRVRMVEDARANRPTFEEAKSERDELPPMLRELEPEEEKPKPPPTMQLPYFYDTKIYRVEVEPEQAKYSGRQAHAVEEEMVKRGKPGASKPTELALNTPPDKKEITPTPDAVKGTLTEREDSRSDPAPPQPARDNATPREDANSTSERELEENKSAKKPDIILPKKGGEIAEGLTPQASPLLAKKGNVGGKSKPSPGKLFPSVANSEEFDKEIGDGGTFNFMEDVAEGERTMINQKRNRYWTFWDRMTRQVRREWSPIEELRKRDPFGNVYGVGIFLTHVDMVLNSDGSVRTLRVGKSSGVSFLDDEAVRALNAAAPFPNPPEGLKDEDGLIHIRFGFALDVQSGEFKIFNFKPKPIF